MGRKQRSVGGVIRDPRTGIVLAREDRHPGADVFRDAPMGEGLPGMRMPAEAEHILAIHFFDNLGYPLTPPKPLYVAVPDPNSMDATGQSGLLWVPRSEAERRGVKAAAEPVVVADISGYSPVQVAAMELQIQQKKVADKLLEQADPHVRGEGAE